MASGNRWRSQSFKRVKSLVSQTANLALNWGLPITAGASFVSFGSYYGLGILERTGALNPINDMIMDSIYDNSGYFGYFTVGLMMPRIRYYTSQAALALIGIGISAVTKGAIYVAGKAINRCCNQKND